jgi:D-beta-D-heptose 7-phosphate kinase/D-beta-D-heptose 1-phosphate adenosyltransferase
LIVFSDYAKGSLALIESLIARCRSLGKTTLVDPKGHDFDRYRGATVLTPNLTELEAVVGPCQDDATLIAKAETLRSALELEAILVTRSEAGMTLIQAGSAPQHFAASAQEVFDVTGAGDTVIATLAGCLSAGLPMAEAARIANRAAGVVVAKLGTASVTPDELTMVGEGLRGAPDRQGVVSASDMLDVVAEARGRGQRVVMTNGCFDLLHPGHIAYLEQAATLGDMLVVAVNDDDSVRRLKGDARPVNAIADRMAVLVGLSAVDYVLPFSEDTPAKLIEALAPDVLVKGGDYVVEEIAGHESVMARGGEVVVLDFLEGHSTSSLIDRLSD